MSSKYLQVIVGVVIVLTALAALAALASCKKSEAEAESKKKLTIGIIQTATHPALDQAREGFIAEMRTLMKGEVEFVLQNGEGSLSQMQMIAENYHSHKKIDAIYAIATPAVQAQARKEKLKPIFIAAVSDPEALGVIYPGTNVCGTSDAVDTDAQAELIAKLFPHVGQVAIIYNPAESNSCVTVKQMEQSLDKKGIRHLTLGLHSESEIAQTINQAVRKAQLILVPADNLIVGAMPLVAKLAREKKCPLVVSDTPSVAKGALVCRGADYQELGKKTAKMAYKVLIEGKSPQEVGIKHPENSKILLNQSVAEELGVVIPEELQSQITLVTGGE
jgi:putative tryptophan/tyrosine transport system substrate-binding protein